MISAAVLAGGSSTRMGRDKALLDLNGRPMICHVVDRLRAVSEDVFVVTKRAHSLDGLDLRVVIDQDEAQTPLSGISRALDVATHEHVFVCACDMPTVSPDLVLWIAERAVGYDAAVPVRDGRGEPLHAVWSAHAIIGCGELAVHRVLEKLRVAWVGEDEWRTLDPTGSSFANVNTPEDLARASGANPQPPSE